MIEMEASTVAVLAAILSVIVSALAFGRQGRWRDSDDARRVDAALAELKTAQTQTEGRVAVLEERVDGEVQRLDGLIDRLERVVMRIEDMLRARP